MHQLRRWHRSNSSLVVKTTNGTRPWRIVVSLEGLFLWGAAARDELAPLVPLDPLPRAFVSPDLEQRQVILNDEVAVVQGLGLRRLL